MSASSVAPRCRFLQRGAEVVGSGRYPVARIGLGRLRSEGGDILLEHARYVIVGREEMTSANILNPPAPWGFPMSVVGLAAVLELADGELWHCVVADERGRLMNRRPANPQRDS
jgi:hypothetical protein